MKDAAAVAVDGSRLHWVDAADVADVAAAVAAGDADTPGCRTGCTVPNGSAVVVVAPADTRWPAVAPIDAVAAAVVAPALGNC